MPSKLGALRIKVDRGGAVKDIRGYLDVIERAYNSFYVFELSADAMNTELRKYRRYDPYFEMNLGIFPTNFRLAYEHEPSNLRRLVSPGDRLTLSSVSIESPGFWEFLGTLNALEVLRRAINDRHSRRQDREFRERQEEERTRLELEQRKTEVYRDRIVLLRENGIPEHLIRSMVNDLIYEPTREVEDLVDSRQVGEAEVKELEG